MQERPPSGSRGEKILFDIFEAEREVFHQPPLYPFERCETRPTGIPTTRECRIALPLNSGAATIPRVDRRRPNLGGRPAGGIRTQPGARTLLRSQPLDSRGKGE